MTETLYTRNGRRYDVWGNAETRFDMDMMRAGQWRMTYCPLDGSKRYSYDVRPDTASFHAAMELAGVAMEEAMRNAANPRPSFRPSSGCVTFTAKQLRVLAECRRMMVECGALLPTHWQYIAPREVVQAGMDALRGWKG